MNATGVPGAPVPIPAGGPAPPPAEVGLTFRYSGLLVRFAASVIDLAILLVFSLVLAIPFGILTWSVSRWTGGFGPWVGLIWGPFLVVVFVLWVVYYTYLEATRGQTFGKRALGLRVVSVATGRPPDVGHALIRNIVRIVDWLPVLYVVGFLFALVTPRKQRLGDILANTVVIQA